VGDRQAVDGESLVRVRIPQWGWLLIALVLSVLIFAGVWWLLPALFAVAPSAVKLHEIKSEGSIDAEAEAKATQVHSAGGLAAVANRIMDLLRGKGGGRE